MTMVIYEPSGDTTIGTVPASKTKFVRLNYIGTFVVVNSIPLKLIGLYKFI